MIPLPETMGSGRNSIFDWVAFVLNPIKFWGC